MSASLCAKFYAGRHHDQDPQGIQGCQFQKHSQTEQDGTSQPGSGGMISKFPTRSSSVVQTMSRMFLDLGKAGSKHGLRHRGGRGDASPPFLSAGGNPPIFRKIVGQIH